ncbi:MAG: hypothetical protein WA063_07415 [Minisyncoccia bacterium]
MRKKIIFIVTITFIILLGISIYFLKKTEFTDTEIINFVTSHKEAPSRFFIDQDQKFLGDYGSVLYADQKINDKNIFYCANTIDDTSKYINEFIETESGGGSKGAEYIITIIETSENDRYFEYKTNKKEKNGKRGHNDQFRIFKCTYIQDLLHGIYGNLNLNKNEIDNIYIGTLKYKPITMEVVKQFSESMWSTGGFNIGHKVLNSFTEKEDGLFKHTIYETNTGCLEQTDCCETTLYKSSYLINENSGEINFSRNKIKVVSHGC